jgi:hypothetical protein
VISCRLASRRHGRRARCPDVGARMPCIPRSAARQSDDESADCELTSGHSRYCTASAERRLRVHCGVSMHIPRLCRHASPAGVVAAITLVFVLWLPVAAQSVLSIGARIARDSLVLQAHLSSKLGQRIANGCVGVDFASNVTLSGKLRASGPATHAPYREHCDV